MVAPTPYFADRGCHVRIYEEARALRALGHDVRIVTYHIGRDLPGIPVLRIPRIPWYNRLEAGPSCHKLYLDLLLLGKATAFSLRFRPQVIHAHLHEGAAIGWLLKLVTRAPLIFDYQGSLSGECIDHGFFKADSRAARIFRWAERFINNSADRIVTSSSAGYADLRANWGVAPERLVSVIDGVDTDQFRPHDRQEARSRLGIAPDVPVVAYLGLMSAYQGTDLLLDAIALLKAQGVQARFLIMGFPVERYREAAEALGIGDMITFTGKVDYREAPLFLSAADLAVSPKLSLTEANGKLFNYMACALPVVVFDTPVNREILGDTGVYAPLGDTAAFAARIADLLADRDGLKGRGERVRAKAVHDHAWQARGARLAEVCRAVTGASEP
ncbi:glycosyltransferase family 4 protein [Oryzomonas sagensis]|uniref:Glycosyltransferase family 4 protein n=2 Tax=Oryzomonas sagensis TaxID=2603857 RepID=A0ABQ6TPM0_9BACT|nr:glycosyltransferase family 4 protein [Oryzomonas sagensis]